MRDIIAQAGEGFRPARLDARTARHEIRPACGADGADLFRRRLLGGGRGCETAEYQCHQVAGRRSGVHCDPSLERRLPGPFCDRHPRLVAARGRIGGNSNGKGARFEAPKIGRNMPFSAASAPLTPAAARRILGPGFEPRHACRRDWAVDDKDKKPWRWMHQRSSV